MTELIGHAFGWICGQNPEHTWSPGGALLPVCQRCTGVYAGALTAALLHLAWRPAPSPRWLWLNGAFLLLMIPSGFYWIPQNPELRCASGILFGFGLVSFLWLPLGSNGGQTTRKNSREQIAAVTGALLGALTLTPVLAENGNAAAGNILTACTTAGALMLAGLLLSDLFVCLRWLARQFSTKPA